MPRPAFELTEAKQLTFQVFGIESSTISLLDSYDDQNFRVETANDDGYVLKISNTDFDSDCLQMQNAAMHLLHEKGLPVPCPVACTKSDSDKPVYIWKCAGAMIALIHTITQPLIHPLFLQTHRAAILMSD
jgi:hypothetical protein